MSRPRRARVDAFGRSVSLGRELLLERLGRYDQAEIARRCGVSRPTITRLASGVLVTDSYAVRRALERELGIPMQSWDEAPTPREAAPDVPSSSSASNVHPRTGDAARPIDEDDVDAA